ncbi:4a-hydroxytetrahydrobiopterin dehydratase [soil metagenome]
MSDSTLTSQKCVPCEGNVKAFTPEQIAIHAPQIPDWTVLDNQKLEKEFTFKNFLEAVAFINNVATIAEEEGHHPDMNLHNWNKVIITLWTHAIKGLFLNDFILAAKIDDLLA